LIYLFENYIVNGVEFEPEQDELAEELLGAGFPNDEIDKAFAWLEELLNVCEDSEPENLIKQSSKSLRFYTARETEQLTPEGLALISRLVGVGVLDQSLRETVIDRIMALDGIRVDLDHVRWVVLMVLTNRPNYDDVAEWAEVVVADEMLPVIH